MSFRVHLLLVLNVDTFNQGPADRVLVLPIMSKTAKSRNIPPHVAVAPSEGGLKTASVILCDQLRALSKNRLMQRWGIVSTGSLIGVEKALRVLLGL